MHVGSERCAKPALYSQCHLRRMLPEVAAFSASASTPANAANAANASRATTSLAATAALAIPAFRAAITDVAAHAAGFPARLMPLGAQCK